MPRLNNGQEILRYLNSVELFKIQPVAPFGDTTLTAALAKAEVSATVAAITNFSNNDPIAIIGSGGTELNHINAAPAGLILSLLYKTRFPQDPGARVVEMMKVNLGHVDESGLDFGASQSKTAVKAATSRTPIAYITDNAELNFNFNLRGYNNLNLALAFDMDDSEDGAGTQADPFTVSIGQNDIGTGGLRVLRATGAREDGRIVQLDILDAQITVNNKINMGGTSPSTITISGNSTGYINRIW